MTISPHRYPACLDAARGQSCVRCGRDDGTVVAAHYTGLRQHIYGKGARIKGSDLVVADLCSKCHPHFDQPKHWKSVEASEEFLHCVMLTIFNRADRGILVVNKGESNV